MAKAVVVEHTFTQGLVPKACVKSERAVIKGQVFTEHLECTDRNLVGLEIREGA